MFKNLFTTTAGLLDRFGHMSLWFVVSLALLLIVAPLNPILLASYLWALSKISAAAAIGYGFDWAAFREADPATLEGIEKAMAQTRRATLIAAAMIAAGLIG
jgi:small-conductance mechanosensitive channel